MSKPVILCVDDERVILQSLRAQLKAAFGDDYVYEMAEDPDEALEVIRELAEEGINITMIVSDWLMPGMRGDEFLIRVHQEFPNIVKVMLTGQADDSAIERAKTEANLHSCLLKPWSEAELVEIVKSTLADL
ncbi:response regulator [Planktothrix sp. FACHB-1355]|uniref:Response regulator n=1 Tax=Aerosakkonema funiforme FACHB-1375 TaxID=2949571 RepID=A0A926ZK04_9CYAN|nr:MULTISPECIES: response regulator [Oscillatoriales]MBD2186128.1 response regulator [Aerosakkonema funiforme FACHB-1375]MBD3560570.1 response regulator [Planktothrix sp. FACHB-1355]